MENTFGWLYSVFVKAYRYETLTHEVFWIFWIFSFLLPLCHDWCLKVQLISRKLSSISSTGGGILQWCKKTVTSIWRSSAENIQMEIPGSNPPTIVRKPPHIWIYIELQIVQYVESFILLNWTAQRQLNFLATLPEQTLYTRHFIAIPTT